MRDALPTAQDQLDFPARLRAFRKLTGMTNPEIARAIEAPVGVVNGWQRGALPRGLALLRFMALAARIPDGMDTMFPLLAADIRKLDAKRRDRFGP